MEGAGLKVSDLACRRGDRVLFRGLSFALEPGQALQVLGTNGTGKSSLLRIVAGLLPPFTGTVERGGEVALLDERLPLDEHQPLGKALAFWDGFDGNDYGEAALASVGLAELADVPVRFLSTGQRKRAAFLLSNRRGGGLWLLDEPLNGLDANGADMLVATVAAFCAQGGCALIASHQPFPLAGLKQFELLDYIP